MAKATTVRFTDELYQRLDVASARTGLPVNSIVVAACLEWMQRHTPEATAQPALEGWPGPPAPVAMAAPRWSTVRRAIELAMTRKETGGGSVGKYPFDRFSDHAKALLMAAQAEAEKAGFSYIGTEHLLLASFAKPDFHSTKILLALAVDEKEVRDAIKNVIGRSPKLPTGGIIPTSKVKKVIEIAFQLCGSMGHPRVGTDHILLAMAAEGEGIAAHVLDDLGATRKRIEAEVGRQAEPES